MGTNTDDILRISQDFDRAHQFYLWAKSNILTATNFTTRSWGMSYDYTIAIEHGSNLVRVGSKIFGAREY